MAIVGDVVMEWMARREPQDHRVPEPLSHCEDRSRQFKAVGIPRGLFTSHTTFSNGRCCCRSTAAIPVAGTGIPVEALAKG